MFWYVQKKEQKEEVQRKEADDDNYNYNAVLLVKGLCMCVLYAIIGKKEEGNWELVRREKVRKREGCWEGWLC